MKKITAILIVLCMIISVFPYVSADLQPSSYSEDYGILSALSVIDPETWSDGTVTTRAQFVQLCVNLTGCGHIKADNSMPVFTDITISHWAYDAVMYAYSMGYIKPDDRGRFMPESPVTYADAVEIMVKFLGYDIMAASGGARAYIKTAGEIGLTDGVEADGSDRPLAKTSAVRMAFNALTVELPLQYYANSYVHFSVQQERTILRTVYNAYRAKGVVKANDYASMSLNLTRKNYVTIDDEDYFSAKVNADDLLGCKTVFYYTVSDTDGRKDLVYIYASGNNVVKISARDMSGYSDNTVYAYNDRGNPVSYRIDHETTVIWNNRVLKSNEYESKFKPESGSISLTDNDGDGIYELAVIKSQKAYKIDVFNTSDSIIKTTDGTVIEIEKYRQYRIENKYGEVTDMLSMNAGDVISVYDPEDYSNAIVIRICGDTETRTVVSVDSADRTITFDTGTQKYYSKSAVDSYSDIKLDNTYTFYFDGYGEIVYSEYIQPADLEVAYLINYKGKRGLDNRVQLKLLRADGTVSITDCASVIKFRDSEGIFTRKNGTEVLTALNRGSTAPKQQAVMIRVNANGLINEIQMLAPPERIDLEFHAIPFTKVGGSGMRWYQPAYTFHNQIQLKSGTVVFAVPHADKNDSDDEKYFTANYRLFKGGVFYPESGESGYIATPIAMKKGGIAADYFVWEYPDDASYRLNYLYTKYYGIVTGIATRLEAETGEEYSEITYCTSSGIFGNIISYKNPNGSTDVKDLNGNTVELGDIISAAVDYDGYANENTVTLYYDCSEDSWLNESSTTNYAFYDTFRLAKGVVTKETDGYISVDITRISGSSVTQIFDISSAITINCNLDKNIFTKGKNAVSMIAEGDSVLLIVSGALPKALVIYEN